MNYEVCYFVFITLYPFSYCLKNYWQKNCGSPDVPSNGYVEFSKGVEVGSFIYYTCVPGYFIFGNQTRECLPEMEWSGSAPICASEIGIGKPLKDSYEDLTQINFLTDGDFRTCATVDDTITVDLLQSYKLKYFRLTGTIDDGFINQISLRIGNNENVMENQLCEFDDLKKQDDNTFQFGCKDCLIGKYVTISRQSLTDGVLPKLCHLEIFSNSEKAFPKSRCYSLNSLFVESINGYCFVIFNKTQDWQTAESSCNDLTGNLASLSDYGVYQNVLFHLKSHEMDKDLNYIWVGAKWQTVFNTFQWISGQSIEADVWRKNNSDISLYPDHCITLKMNDGKLHKKTCVTQQPFMCMIGPVACGTPVRHNYERFSHRELFAIDDIVEYTCDVGFFHKNNHGYTRLCLPDGTWSTEHEHCELPCGEPPKIPNYSYVNLSQPFKSLGQIIYKCQPGFQLKGEFPNCTLNGTWQTLPKCKIIHCGSPNLPTHGSFKLISKDDSLNATAELFCLPGWKLFGKNKIRCLETGNWSFSDAICKYESEIDTTKKKLSSKLTKSKLKPNKHIYFSTAKLSPTTRAQIQPYVEDDDFLSKKSTISKISNQHEPSSAANLSMAHKYLIVSIIIGLSISAFLILILKAIQLRFTNDMDYMMPTISVPED